MWFPAYLFQSFFYVIQVKKSLVWEQTGEITSSGLGLTSNEARQWVTTFLAQETLIMWKLQIELNDSEKKKNM